MTLAEKPVDLVELARSRYHSPPVFGTQLRRDQFLVTEEDDVIRVQGTVVQNLPNAMFKVEIDGGLEVLADVSGKMRMRRIRILPGDRVDVELSAYDPTRGRIVWRFR